MKFIYVVLLVKFSQAVEQSNPLSVDVDEALKNDPLTETSCKSDEFNCGYNCISSNLVCDGKEDCAGGADELNDFCEIPHVNASCFLPLLPPDQYEFTINYTMNKTQRIPEFVQGTFKCKPGYLGDPVNKVVSRCFQRNWEPAIMRCQKHCPVISNPDIQQMCHRGLPVDCNGIIWEKTRVIISCQKLYHEPNYREAICLPSGKWNINIEQIKCNPICGSMDEQTADALNHTDFPWRVTIREQINQTVRYFSGTLIDKKMVLTDANSFGRSKSPYNYEILVNDNIESWGPPRSYGIKTIYFLPARYRKFTDMDGLGKLAILEPSDNIEYSVTVSPICVLPFSYPASLEAFDSTGKMVTLGNTIAQTKGMELNRNEFLILEVKSIKGNINICKINDEKCDQFYGILETNKTIFNDADQGTGLFKKDKELKLYFIEGVYTNQHSDSSKLRIFTFASNYIEWIDEVREITKQNITITLKRDIPSHSIDSILTVFVLLSFVILVAVLLRIK